MIETIIGIAIGGLLIVALYVIGEAAMNRWARNK